MINVHIVGTHGFGSEFSRSPAASLGELFAQFRLGDETPDGGFPALGNIDWNEYRGIFPDISETRNIGEHECASGQRGFERGQAEWFVQRKWRRARTNKRVHGWKLPK